jgi:hypothetical protein
VKEKCSIEVKKKPANKKSSPYAGGKALLLFLSPPGLPGKVMTSISL